MPDYVIEVQYSDGEPPLRIPLAGYEPDDAELERQYIAHEIEHAREIESPLMLTELRSGPLEEHLAIPVVGVTSVDLLDG
ncbi:MAG: hypothetical protein QOG80_2199 [Pseudonocardiales bacterium]|jgi:hypothetical protein|nr:hypothetical protein [Pseudonocardiales bacterium]